MATQTIELACTKMAAVDAAYPTNNFSAETDYQMFATQEGLQRYILMGFAGLASQYQHNRIYRARFKFWPSEIIIDTQQTGWLTATMYAGPLYGEFQEGEVTYETRPGLVVSGGSAIGQTYLIESDTGKFNDAPDDAASTGVSYLSQAGQRAARYGVALSMSPTSTYAYAYQAGKLSVRVDSRRSAHTPALEIEFDDTEKVEGQVDVANAPTSGYIDKTKNTYFSGKIVRQGDYYSFLPPEWQSGTLYWREGTIGEWNAVPIVSSSGVIGGVYVPANTFPTSESIQWYIEATDTSGHTSQTDIYTVRTSDYETTATPTSPKGTVEDGSSPIMFSWATANQAGNDHRTGFYLQYYDSGWQDIADITGSSAASYAVPANTFPPGNISWRVAVYNLDGVLGPWSTSVQFTNVAAPPAPSVTTDSAPFTTINWQGTGQQAYRLEVDGKDYGVKFGTAKTFTLPDYLEDGEHTASVIVQGQYGLWSQPGEVTFTVQNIPGDPVELFGSFGVDAELNWITSSTEPGFLVYRDGKRIASVTETVFTDRLVLGEHTWAVINLLPGGYYTKSNELTGTPKSCTTIIDTLENPTGWLELRLSENSDTRQRFSYQKTSSLRHFMGAALPVLEMSSFEDGSGSYDVAFETVAEAKAFEAFKGKVVIIKSRGGNVVIGALNNLEKIAGDFYIAYTFTVQRIFWEDFINGTDS